MIPARFDHRAPQSADEAVALLAAAPDRCQILGGGTWVIPAMSHGECHPHTVIDLARAGLSAIHWDGAVLRIGSMATYAQVLQSPEVAAHAPLLVRAAATVTGGWAIRNQGTIGGSLAAARPQSDLPGALMACGASAIVQGPAGTRRVPIGELIVGAMRTSLAADELLVAVEIPAVASTGVGYVKLKRGASSWPIVTASAVVRRDSDRGGVVRLVIGAASEVPLPIDLPDPLPGDADAEWLAEVARVTTTAVTAPWDDALAPGSYRAAVAGVAARRAMAMALDLGAGA
jgi:CO/xanthine dehydrogenase FAD-binding subunit